MSYEQAIPDMNDLLANCSRQCTVDAMQMMEMLEVGRNMKLAQDQQLDEQFHLCYTLACVLTWATLHPEDFSELASWWNKDVAPGVLATYNEL